MPKTSDAIALLKADHRKVEELFEKYQSSRSRKAEIANQICTELTIHTLIEEEIFYPACRGVVEDDALDEAFVEHDGAKVMITQLENGSPDDDFYDAKMKVLSEEIKHHVKEEEKRDGVFAQLRAGDVDLVVLAEQIQERKKELTAAIKQNGLPTPIMTTMTGNMPEMSQMNA